MVDKLTVRGRLTIFCSGATVFSALLLLGYLVVGTVSFSLSAVLLGVGVLLLALVVAAGSWTERRWLRLATWPATLALLVLGFLGTAVGPQIVGVAAFALLTAVVTTFSDSGAG